MERTKAAQQRAKSAARRRPRRAALPKISRITHGSDLLFTSPTSSNALYQSRRCPIAAVGTVARPRGVRVAARSAPRASATGTWRRGVTGRRSAGGTPPALRLAGDLGPVVSDPQRAQLLLPVLDRRLVVSLRSRLPHELTAVANLPPPLTFPLGDRNNLHEAGPPECVKLSNRGACDFPVSRSLPWGLRRVGFRSSTPRSPSHDLPPQRDVSPNESRVSSRPHKRHLPRSIVMRMEDATI